MITAIFNNKMDSTVAYGLWQWDYGQVLRIKGIDFSQFAIEIHFSFNEDDEDSTIAVGVVKEVEYESTILDDGETKVTSETIQVLDVTIPKDFLWNRNKKNYTIYVFLHLSNEEIGHTIKKILLPVKIKARPTYPHASEDEALFHSTLEQINELAETTVENAKIAKSYAVGNTGVREGEDTDNAKYYAEQASISLEEATLQAENAEQSADNAKEYEENAELSANKAKEYELSSKTNADNAQGYMDWAYEYKDNAQEYSISARDYRDEAESAKNISLQASIDTGKVRDEVKNIQTDVKNIQTQINNVADSVDNTVIEINGLVEQVETNAETVATNTEITNQNKVATDEAKTSAEEILASSRQINADVLEIKNQIMGFADDATRIVDEGIAEHNISSTAHDDIRQLIVGLNDRLNTVLNSDDETLDQLSEIVDYIKDNRDLIETITSSKVNVSDIIDNLTTVSSNKPLSAKQGKILKDLIDAIKIPTKVSAFENDKGYLTEHQSLEEYVKNTDYATPNKGGVAKASGTYGLAMNTSGFISTVPAPKIFIKNGEEQFKPITPRHQHESTFYGLAKASGDTSQSVSNNDVGNYTDEAKASIQSMLGVPSTKQLEDYTTLNIFYDDVIDNTTSGNNIVSFNDGANNLPIQDLIINIEPNQDLHGYDSPWASGCGKNLRSGLDFANDVKGRMASAVIDETEKTVSFAYNASQTTDHFPNVAYKENTQYTFFIVGKNPTIARSNLRLYYTDGTYANIADFSAVDTKETKLIVSNANKTVASLAKTSNGGTTVLYYDECGVFEGVLTADQFTPYSNICPISGWTESNVVACGKNLLNPNYSAYQISNSYLFMDGVVPEGQTARFTFIDKDTSVDVSSISIGFQNGLSVGSSPTAYNWAVGNGDIRSNVTNVKNGVTCSGVFIYPKTQEAFDALFSRWDIMVELGSTATAYEPYHGTPITIDFGQTVYGGVLDVLSGKLTVNRTKITAPSYSTSQLETVIRIRVTTPGSLNWDMTNLKSNVFKPITSSNAYTPYGIKNMTAGKMYAYVPLGTSEDEITALMSQCEICYKLGTPIEVQLDPHTLNTLLGYNNIYTDVNGNISITYKANTKAYIDNKVMDNVPDLTSYVKNTDYATTTVGGVIKVSGTYGSGIDSNGVLYIYKASDAEVKAGTNSYKPITPNSQHRSVFYGLAKASGDTTQASSANAIGVYTNDAKTKIKTMLDIPTKTSELTNDSNFINTSYQIYATDDDNGNVTIHFGISS